MLALLFGLSSTSGRYVTVKVPPELLINKCYKLNAESCQNKL